jgi:hypothetical protein
MEEKIKELFDLDQIKRVAEENIDMADWIEEPCGGKRKVLVIDTLVSGWHGAYIPGMVLKIFGRADGFDLDNPYNWTKNEWIHDALQDLENEVNDALNLLIESKGLYFVGFHEADGSYCLFYEEEEIEE